MTIQVNGDPMELSDGSPILQLLEQLQLNPDGVAVALNLEVVPRTQHAEVTLRHGDRIELVRAVGGG